MKTLELEKEIGKDKSEEIVKLINNYNKYASKFKNKVNMLLSDAGYEIKIGAKFLKKEDWEKLKNGGKTKAGRPAKRSRT